MADSGDGIALNDSGVRLPAESGALVLDATATAASTNASATEHIGVTEAATLKDDDDDTDDSIPVLPDDFLDVVVTSVDALDSNSAGGVASASTAGVVASASSLLLGSQEYVVELVVTKGSGSYCMRRSLSELLAVLQLAASAASNPRELLCTREMPVFPAKQSKNDAMIARWCGEMTHFLAGQSAVLRDVPQWIAFVEESSHGIGSRAHMTAIEFILQPFPYEKLYVPRGSRHEVVVAVKNSARFIVWKFELEEHDIDFSVTFRVDPQWQSRQPLLSPDSASNAVDNDDASNDPLEHAVHARTRYLATTTGRPIEGMYKCPGEGRATLVWDNSYSRLRGKNILYQAQVVSSEIMESASTAADALDEALRAKRKERDDALAASLSTALIVSPQPAAPEAAGSLYRTFLPETLRQQSWLVSTPMSVAGKFASRLFGSQTDDASSAHETSNAASHNDTNDGDPSTRPRDSAHAKSLLEELNGLNMQLLERLESLEDKVVQLTVERDQERSRTHMAVVDKENTTALVKMKELEVDGLRNELQRMQREREAWREIQSERDALLEEKHRWAMTDDFHADEYEDGSNDASARDNMDSEVRVRLEHELGQAEAAVLRLRAELGYSLSNHLTGTSTRLEKIAREMTGAKKQYEDAMKDAEHDVVQLKQQLLKFRCQKRVLVTELRNLKTQTEGQVAVAMAEASEARMVNTRLKKQNELLLTQIRSLVDDSRDAERRVTELQQQMQQQQQETNGSVDADVEEAVETAPEAIEQEESSADSIGAMRDELDPIAGDANSVDDDSPVPYTLSATDIALLNGEAKAHAAARSRDDLDTCSQQLQLQQHVATAVAMHARFSEDATRRSSRPTSAPMQSNRHRARLVAFFEARDPSMLDQVDDMLASYVGVESSLFESLEFKYSFMELSAQSHAT